MHQLVNKQNFDNIKMLHGMDVKIYCCVWKFGRNLYNNNTGQQNLTFFFGTRGKISNPNRTFKAEFKCVSSFSLSPTVCL